MIFNKKKKYVFQRFPILTHFQAYQPISIPQITHHKQEIKVRSLT
jgi:ABC-type lipoprotein export system ATPase subunit